MGNTVQTWWQRMARDLNAGSDAVRPQTRGPVREEDDLSPETAPLCNQLRAMPKLQPPTHVTLNLRIMASKEHARAIRFQNWPNTFRYIRSRVSLHLENMMKPFAVPAFGGLAAALMLFLMLAPVYPIRSVNAASLDVPTRLNTSASVKTMASFTAVEKPVTLLVFVSNEGRVVGYRIEGDQEAMDNLVTRRRIEQMLLFTVFTPATSFGMPTSDQVWISVGSNVVLVHG